MSFTQVRPYFSARLTALGFTEWTDGFADDNIPSTILDRSFFQSIINISGNSTTAMDLETTVTVQLHCYFKGFRDPASAIDESILKSEDIITACVNTLNQSGTQIKGVYFNNLTIEPLSDNLNDNIVRAVIVFDCKVFLCID